MPRPDVVFDVKVTAAFVGLNAVLAFLTRGETISSTMQWVGWSAVLMAVILGLNEPLRRKYDRRSILIRAGVWAALGVAIMAASVLVAR